MMPMFTRLRTARFSVGVIFLFFFLLASDAADKTLFDRVLELNRVQEPELDTDAAKKAFDAIVARSKEALNGTNTPREKIAALNKVLLGDRKVAYLSNKYWRDATLTACLLRTHG